MLRFFRVRAWCLATSLFLAMGTAGTSLEFLLHDDASHHGDPCAAPLTPHDEGSHRIGNGSERTPDGAGTHCIACHLARAVRLRTEQASLSARPDDALTLRVPPSIGVALSPALASLHPRSPPRVA